MYSFIVSVLADKNLNCPSLRVSSSPASVNSFRWCETVACETGELFTNSAAGHLLHRRRRDLLKNLETPRIGERLGYFLETFVIHTMRNYATKCIGILINIYTSCQAKSFQKEEALFLSKPANQTIWKRHTVSKQELGAGDPTLFSLEKHQSASFSAHSTRSPLNKVRIIVLTSLGVGVAGKAG
jgi:hypothetical protein